MFIDFDHFPALEAGKGTRLADRDGVSLFTDLILVMSVKFLRCSVAFLVFGMSLVGVDDDDHGLGHLRRGNGACFCSHK